MEALSVNTVKMHAGADSGLYQVLKFNALCHYLSDGACKYQKVTNEEMIQVSQIFFTVIQQKMLFIYFFFFFFFFTFLVVAHDPLTCTHL